MMKKYFTSLKKWAIAGSVFVAASAQGAPFLTFDIVGPEFSFYGLTASSFTRPSTNFDDFWSFCSASNCIGGGLPDVAPESTLIMNQVLGAPDTASINLGFGFPFVESAVTSSAPKAGLPGLASFMLAATDKSLSMLPTSSGIGNAVGLQLKEILFGYLQDFSPPPGPTGALEIKRSWAFDVNTTFDPNAIPSGYLAEVNTLVDVVLSWTDLNDLGVPTFQSQTVFSGTAPGTGVFEVSLPANLSDYPQIMGQSYATYYATVRHQITLMPTPVPEPSSIALLLIGLLSVVLVSRRANS